MFETMRRVTSVLFVVGSLSALLGACAVGRSTMGMELSPGRVVEVEIGGREPTLHVTNHGPGNVSIHVVSPSSEQDLEIGPGVNLTQELLEPSHLKITTTGDAVTTIHVALSNDTDLLIRG